MSFIDGISQCWWLSKSCVVDWDAWSAIATVAAVWAALHTSGKALKAARRERDATNTKHRKKEELLADRLALVFHQELFDYGVQIAYERDSLGAAVKTHSAGDLLDFLRDSIPHGAMPLLDRSAVEVDVLGPEAAYCLTAVLAGWLSLKTGPSADLLEGSSDKATREGVNGYVARLSGECERVENALRALAPRLEALGVDAPCVLPITRFFGDWKLAASVSIQEESAVIAFETVYFPSSAREEYEVERHPQMTEREASLVANNLLKRVSGLDKNGRARFD